MAFSPGAITPIQAQASGLEILVGGTDEEFLIARETYRLLDNP
jgi:acetate kinase